jgi:flavorubredoxin
MDQPYQAGDDVTVLPSHLDVPGVGTLVVNAFVLHSSQPVLVDTGLAADTDDFVDALRSVIDPSDLAWVWITHDDADHTGSLQAVMELAPRARLATHALGALRMSTWWPTPLERVHALALGERIDAGDRTLVALRPPTFDNPTTTGFFDERTATLFAVDAFGAILPGAVTDVDDVAEEVLIGGMVAWATFDSPWIHLVDRALFGEALDAVRAMDPARVLTSHLPPVSGRIDRLLEVVETVPDAERFVAPDAAAFQEIAAQLAQQQG